ncbi:MAG: hypothetical protein LBE58_01800 [Comamonas sp.]|jgi:hypothetical protein|nr:hypothetical protein [Comamonas sp.]
MYSSDFIHNLNSKELLLEATPLVLWDKGIVENMDDVAKFLWRGGPQPPQASARPPKDTMGLIVDKRPEMKYWEMVKVELTIFLCSKDRKYKNLWSRINALESKGTNAIVLVVSGYLGEKFGLQASMLAGFVAVFFYGILKIGKEAYCRLAYLP